MIIAFCLQHMQMTRHSIIDILQTFSQFSNLKENISKCEIADIAFLKGVTETVCGLKLIDLTIDIYIFLQ